MTSNSFSARQDYCPTRMRHSSGVRSKVWLSGPDPVPLQARRGLVLKFSSFIQVKVRTPPTDIIASMINSLPQIHIRSSKLIPVMNLGFASFAPAHLHLLTGACVVAMPTKSCIFLGDKHCRAGDVPGPPSPCRSQCESFWPQEPGLHQAGTHLSANAVFFHLSSTVGHFLLSK